MERRGGDDASFMVTCDLEYRITSWNRAASALFGLSADEAIGKSMPEIICAKEFAGACYAIFAEVRGGRVEWEGEMLARRSDQQLFHSEVRIMPVQDTTGAMVGLSAIGKDLTEDELQVHDRVGFAQYLIGECNLSPATAFTYEQGLLRLEKHLGMPADKIATSPDDVRRFLRMTDYHPATKGSTLVSIKAYHKWGALDGRWELNGLMALRGPKIPKNPKRPLRPHEVLKYLEVCRTPAEFRLVYLGLYGGLRITESASITEENWLSDRLRFIGKGRKERDVPIHPELDRVKSKILSKTSARGSLLHTMRSLAYYTGIPATSHIFRKCFASRLIDGGVQEGVVEDLLGHEPRSVLRSVYALVTDKERFDAVSRLTYKPDDERPLP